MDEKCAKWLQQPTVNPETSRSIKIGGPTYSRLALECGTAPSQRQPHICDQWRALPHVNPTTGRTITIGGPTWSKLEKTCRDEMGKLEKTCRDEMGLQKTCRAAMGKLVKEAVSAIDVTQWNMCVTGKHSEFRSKLSHVKFIGKGTFGEVYAVKLGQLEFVVKEAYLTIGEKRRMMRVGGRKNKSGETQSYPEEYRIATLVQKLLGSTPNFLYVYDLSVCEGCQLTGKQLGTCYVTFMEVADGDLYGLFRHNEMSSCDAQASVLYQILIAVNAIHSTYGIYHRDIKLENILYKRISPGGFISYHVNGYSIRVKNTGVLALLADFGVAKVLCPAYSGASKRFGVRNAKVVGDTLEPIVCEFTVRENQLERATQIKWKEPNGTVVMGTYNNFYDNLNLGPSIHVDLNDPRRFPPFEFFHDIQDVIRMFIGGKQTVQAGSHTRIPRLDTTLGQVLSRCVIDKFPYNTRCVKYLIAIEMLIFIQNVMRVEKCL